MQPIKRYSSSLSVYFLFMARLFFKVKRHTLLAVVFNLLSEILKILSFIIPIKIILLLSSSSIPEKLTSYMVVGTLNEWILFLAVMTVVTYLLSVSCAFFFRKSAKQGADAIKLKRQEKEPQWNVRKSREIMNLYKTSCESLADLVLLLLCLAALVFFNQKVALVFLAAVSLFLLFLFFFESMDQTRNTAVLQKKYPIIIHVMFSMSFFVVFIFMIVDYMYFSPIDPLSAIISLILGRRLTMASEKFFKRVVRLMLMKERVGRVLMLEKSVRV